MSRYNVLKCLVPADKTPQKRAPNDVQLGGGRFEENWHEENDATSSVRGHIRDQYSPYVTPRPAHSQPVNAWCSPGARSTEPYGSPEPDRHQPYTSSPWISPQPQTPSPQPCTPGPTAHEQILERLNEPRPSAGGPLPFTPNAQGERAFLYTQLVWPAAVTLGLMGIGLPDAALSACFLTGLGNARTESQLLGQLEVLAYKVALDSSGGNGGGAAAGGGCGRYGSGGADPRDQARKDAISTWRELCTCGLVKVGEGGVITYDPKPPQKPPYRVLKLRLSMQKPDPGSCPPTASTYDISLRRYADAAPNKSKGSATIPISPNRTPKSPATPPPASPATRPPPVARAQLVLQPELSQFELGSFLTRHPELAACDRLARVDASAVMRDAVLQQDSCDDGRKEAKARAAMAALEALVQRGFVFAGRKYMFLLGKENDLWFLAVASVLREDLAGWRLPAILHTVRDAWPLLGAAGRLPTVQQMCARAELWASPTVPLHLDHRWTVKLVDDLKGRDPVTGQEVVLDDGAGRAHPDLWPAMQAAWGAHHAAKDAAAGNAAGSWATGSAACGCPPVQMRMHIKLCKSRPRVMAKGTLSPDATLPPYTIVLPLSCVKAPKGDTLQAWMALAESGCEEALLRGELTQPTQGGVSGDGNSSGISGVLHAASQGQAPDEPRQGSSGCVEPGYEAPIVLELNRMGAAATEGRLNTHLVLLLEHWGLPEKYLKDLMDVEVKAVKNTVATPEGARRRLRGEERDRRFSLLRDRIQSGWGHSGPEAWDSRDAHLQQELLRLLHRGYDSLRKLKISMPGCVNALGVPDHTRSLHPRQVTHVGPSGYAEAGATPLRALLYRHPGLHPMDLLAVWLVPPPKELQDGFGPKLRNALVMSTQGGEPMAAQLATGDYDGDQFVLITNPVAVEACWARLNEAYDEDQLRRAADWREEQSQRQQQQQEEEKTAGYQPQDADAAGGSGRPSGGRAEQPAAAEWEAARAQGQLWFLKPRLAEQDPQDLILLQMAHFLIHAEACQVAVGTFNTMWCKWVEVAADRDGGVGGPRCAKLAQMYADALDAKKHLLMPQASHEMKEMTKQKQLPRWHEQQWDNKDAPACSAASAMFKCIPSREQLEQEAGLQLTAAALQPDQRLVARAVRVLGSQEAWARLVEACGQVYDRDWNRPWWCRRLAEESRTAAGAAGPRRSDRDAQRQEAGETGGFKLSLVEAVRRELIRAGRACGLDGHLQLGGVTDDPTRVDDLNLGHRLALAAAFYAAVYGNRESRMEARGGQGEQPVATEVQDDGQPTDLDSSAGAGSDGGKAGGTRLGHALFGAHRCKDQDNMRGQVGVVWEVAGEELNTLYRLVTFGGSMRTAAPWWL